MQKTTYNTPLSELIEIIQEENYVQTTGGGGTSEGIDEEPLP